MSYRPKMILLAVCIMLQCVNPSSAQSAAASTEVYVDFRASDSIGSPSARLKLYGASHALIIGIDRYRNGWPRLSNAVKDAKIVAEALKKRKFQVDLVLNPDSEHLRKVLRRFFVEKGADPQARLFVWFAGHGYTERGEGYLVPADAPAPDSPEFLISALHMRDMGSMVRLARSKHVLSIFDSCFSGTIFSGQRARPPAAITKVAMQPVRQFITSGDKDQQVSDDGTFRALFIDALEGREPADLNGDGYVTGTELGFFLEDRVTNLTDAVQTPRSGKLRARGYDRGDFVFVVQAGDAAAVASDVQTAPIVGAAGEISTAELTFWESVTSSLIPGDYRAYLESYPRGYFAPLARARIETIQSRGKGTPAPQAEPPAHAENGSEVQREASASTGGTGATPASGSATPKALSSSPSQSSSLLPITKGSESNFEEARRYVSNKTEHLGRALLAYEGLMRLVLLPANGRETSKVKFTRTDILAADGESVVAALSFTVQTSWGSTLVADVFELRWVGQNLVVVNHGDAARARLASSG